MLTVNFEDKKWHGVTIKRGQRLTSYPKLSRELGLSIKQIRTALKKLEKSQNAAAKGQAMGLMVTVLDFDRWQAKDRTRAGQGQDKGRIRATTKEGQEYKEGQELKRMRENFDQFRIIYPGSKRGLDVEFDNFKKKHPNYNQLMQELIPAIEAQIKQKNKLRSENKFTPEWPHLQTWINNSRWTEEIPVEVPQAISY